MFSKILIANRGEIAVRIIRACKEMGISTVAVFSEADRYSLHVSLADESICIGGSMVKDSYLNMNSIISAAEVTGSQAIHPGYGFLSENAEFAKLCRDNNIIWIGPGAEIISKMGDKEQARNTMAKAGVPIILGCDVVKDVKQATEEAKKIGYPLMVKARSGGGGRGIRIVKREEDLEAAYLSASKEAQSAFGDGGLYMERYVRPAKHVELQIIRDKSGKTLCLGDRECSIQRKNQKLIEESPVASISEELRKEMYAASIAASDYIEYENAGTLEFLVDKDENFFFMEMNTRLQVEHTVTEMVTDVDIVKTQIRIAAGINLELSQSDIKINCHAIECRINAEDIHNNFNPCVGKIETLHIPGGPWVRFDSFIYNGYEIPPFYDSMIGKLIVKANSREEAIRKMNAALCELIIEGVPVNTDLHLEILDSELYKNGNYYTDFMEKR